MDGATFDALVKRLTQTRLTRWEALRGVLATGLVGLTGAYASEWSLLSMYLLFIAVVTFRARGFFGKKSVLDV